MNKFAGDCPAFIVVAEQPYNRSAAGRAERPDHAPRTSAGWSQLVYRAHELGLSTRILGWFDEKTPQALLNDARVVIIAITCPRGRCAAHQNANPWKNLSPAVTAPSGRKRIRTVKLCIASAPCKV
ncbi:MAG: hypothetical protein ACLSWY_01040 [Ruthenibacterium lactatiformans]